MRRRARNPIEELRTAIDCLPVDTRVAMLEGVRSNDIIVGAYTDRNGGVCPMLAAHRCGGRTDLLAFAHAWDRFGREMKGRARRASERELRILTAHLEDSLLAEHRPDLESAIHDHRRLKAQRGASAEPVPQRKARPGEPDRSSELSRRPGWSWLRPFRRYDDYRRALARVEAERERSEAQTRESRRELIEA